MTIRVLVVDDSNFFCQQLTQILNADAALKVIGVANNGRDAIAAVKKLKPDVVTMDVEMPVMDGITAVTHIMKELPTPILMLSSLTFEGARLTLDALSAGAVDFQLKSYESLSASNLASANNLRDKVKGVAASRIAGRPTVATGARPTEAQPVDVAVARKFVPERPRLVRRGVRRSRPYRLLLIGASTGGPVAVQKLLTALPADFPMPVVVVQHMPATFTGAFASRLNNLCRIQVSEANDGAMLRCGAALIAPGGKQIYFRGTPNNAKVQVRGPDPRLNYQPCVDVTFASAAKVFGGDVLASVLTGMGADGCEGAKLLKHQGATIWAQNEASCVVYGMPMAVVKAGLADNVLGINEFSAALLQETSR